VLAVGAIGLGVVGAVLTGIGYFAPDLLHEKHAAAPH